MKIILIDVVHTFVSPQGKIYEDMHTLLESYPHTKYILTGADDAQMEKFGLYKMPYEVFTLKHNPEKKEADYYVRMLDYFGLDAKECVYIEHNKEAVMSAQSVGIETFWYDTEKRDFIAVKCFLDKYI